MHILAAEDITASMGGPENLISVAGAILGGESIPFRIFNRRIPFRISSSGRVRELRSATRIGPTGPLYLRKAKFALLGLCTEESRVWRRYPHLHAMLY